MILNILSSSMQPSLLSDSDGDDQDEAHPDQPAAVGRGAEHSTRERSSRSISGSGGHCSQAGLQPGKEMSEWILKDVSKVL